MTQVNTLVSDQDEKTRVKTRVKIIEKLKTMPSITNQELASELGLTLKGIEWQIKKLKEEKLIKHCGVYTKWILGG